MSVTTEADRVDQLEQRVDELEDKVKEQQEWIEELEGVHEEKQELQETVEEQRDLIEELEAELQAYREENEKDKAEVKQRVTDLEQRQDKQEEEAVDRDDDQNGDAAEEDRGHGGTPLDQIVQLPESVAETELTANQERARFVAKDVLDYASKVPAGYTVTSSDIRTILAAKDGGTPHTETVSRVMNFLDRFGGESVKTVKRHGKRRVVFTEEAATQFHSADARDQDEATGVVMVAGVG